MMEKLLTLLIILAMIALLSYVLHIFVRCICNMCSKDTDETQDNELPYNVIQAMWDTNHSNMNL